jgi:flagellar operon protein
MDLKKLQSFESLIPSQPTVKPQQGITPEQGPSFKDTLKETLTKGNLSSKLSPAQSGQPDLVKFSNHALERMNTRGIAFTQEDMTRLNEAVNRAASKGSKDSLILMKDSALIVSVKNKTVVTVMDKTALKENVFTNIDSTVVL